MGSIFKAEQLIAADFQQMDSSGFAALQAKFDAMQAETPTTTPVIPDSSPAATVTPTESIASPLLDKAPQDPPVSATTTAAPVSSSSDNSSSKDQIDPPEHNPAPKLNSTTPVGDNSSVPDNKTLEDPNDKDDMKNG